MERRLAVASTAVCVLAIGIATAVATTNPGWLRPGPTASTTDHPRQVMGAANTGVPAGVELRPTGSITITEPGTLIDGVHVRGEVIIAASDVTVRNALVQSATEQYPIRVVKGVSGTLIEHVEVDNLDSSGIGIYFQGGSGTVRFANIHSAEDGIRIEANGVTVENSFIHDLFRHPDGHHDALQIRRGDNVTIRNNTLQVFNARTGDPMNAAVQIGSLVGNDTISNLKVLDNLMNGGNYTVNGGGRGEVESAVYSGNRFGRDYRFGVRGNLENSTWASTNVWDDTGEPAG